MRGVAWVGCGDCGRSGGCGGEGGGACSRGCCSGESACCERPCYTCLSKRNGSCRGCCTCRSGIRNGNGACRSLIDYDWRCAAKGSSGAVVIYIHTCGSAASTVVCITWIGCGDVRGAGGSRMDG